MNRKLFKLSVVSSAILATTQVSAALYNVMEVTPSTTYSYKSSYGVAIEQPTSFNVFDAKDNCFENSSAGGKACDSYTLAGETRLKSLNSSQSVDGVSFREEAPFAFNDRNAFDYLDSYDDFINYCEIELRYSTCSYWARDRWDVWNSEINGSNTPNSIAFTGSSTTGTAIDENYNIVVNSLHSSTPVGIGFKLSINSKIRELIDINDASDTDFRAWRTDDTTGSYTVGSKVISSSSSNYTTKAAIINGGTTYTIDWPSNSSVASNKYAQGSMRDLVIVGTEIYGVGFNSYNSSENYMNATIFHGSTTALGTWDSVSVSGATVEVGGELIHSNSVVTSVNHNFIAIGSAKRDGYKPKTNAAANRLFIVDDVRLNSVSAVFPSGGILFDGAGGKAGAINNYNEIVGQIDFENTREVDGKPRRKRGFIYPYVSGNYNGSDFAEYEKRAARFKNKAWYLDDLTNDGSLSGNNQYRVVDATDINDAGVISGTALKCSGGYSTTSHNSSCSGTETVVAVKLVPIAGATSSDISQRGTDTTTSERSGGSLGLWSLILLTLGWFRRK
ncbi:DUF3466 family protein [Vibrio sp. C8]